MPVLSDSPRKALGCELGISHGTEKETDVWDGYDHRKHSSPYILH